MAKTKALISFAVAAKLICVFVFAYAKSRFSHDEAHIVHRRVNVVYVSGTFSCIDTQGNPLTDGCYEDPADCTTVTNVPAA